MKLTKEDLQRIFVPTRKQASLIVGLTLLVFVVFHFNLVFLRITQNSIFSDPNLQQNFAQQFQSFTDTKVINTISLVIFWGGVGLVAYSIIFSIYSVFTEAKNETVVSGEYTNKASKAKRLQVDLVQAGILAGIIALGLLSLNITFPFWINIMAEGILNIPGDLLTGIGQILLAFAGSLLNIYLFKVLISCIIVLE